MDALLQAWERHYGIWAPTTPYNVWDHDAVGESMCFDWTNIYWTAIDNYVGPLKLFDREIVELFDLRECKERHIHRILRHKLILPDGYPVYVNDGFLEPESFVHPVELPGRDRFAEQPLSPDYLTPTILRPVPNPAPNYWKRYEITPHGPVDTPQWTKMV